MIADINRIAYLSYKTYGWCKTTKTFSTLSVVTTILIQFVAQVITETTNLLFKVLRTSGLLKEIGTNFVSTRKLNG